MPCGCFAGMYTVCLCVNLYIFSNLEYQIVEKCFVSCAESAKLCSKEDASLRGSKTFLVLQGVCR